MNGDVSGDSVEEKSMVKNGVSWMGKKTALALILFSLMAVVLSCQTTGEPLEDSSGSLSEPEASTKEGDGGLAVDRIVFMTTEGELFLVNPDGSGEVKLAGATQVRGGPLGAIMAQPVNTNVFYSWPTWSPDGTKLAASLVDVTSGQPEISVQVIDAETGAASAVFRNEAPGLIAEGTPHYLYWSPDSRTLAVLASTPQGLTLFAADTDTLTEPIVIETGAPLYFHWAADGQSMLMHVGDELKLLTRPFGASSTDSIEADPGFRVPALSPDGSKMAYLGTGGSLGSLLIAGTNAPATTRNALEIGPRAAFAWSPKSGEMAVVDQENLSTPTFQRLRVIPGDGGSARTVVEGRIIAFYWSPDGDKLAWVGLDANNNDFVWWAADASGGPTRELLRAQPTSDMLTTLSFFDQYAYSHSPWSPDSSRLVLAVVPNRSSSSSNGSTPLGPRIFVVDAVGTEEPLQVAAGSMAFWSWN
jgi:Tol biopolymer transport system component